MAAGSQGQVLGAPGGRQKPGVALPAGDAGAQGQVACIIRLARCSAAAETHFWFSGGASEVILPPSQGGFVGHGQAATATAATTAATASLCAQNQRVEKKKSVVLTSIRLQERSTI